MQVSTIENEQTATNEQTGENCQNRTITFKHSYEELTPSSSRSESNRLIGFQKDPKLQERQQEQQRTENQNANAPKDLRDKINAGRREPENKATNQVPRQTEESQPLLRVNQKQEDKR